MLMSRGMFKGLINYQRERLKEARKSHRDRLKAADQLASELCRESDLIVRAYCFAYGQQQPARRRTVLKEANTEMDNPYTNELRELVERAGYGDETALPELRKLLDQTPELWKQVGDVAKHVETAWVKLLAGGNLLTQECLHREAERRRTALLGDNPTAIERHLIEAIIASWLQLQHAEIQMSNSMGVTDSQLNFFHRRLESAQKQHRTAIDQLVKIRKVERATKRKRKSTVNTHEPDRIAQSRKRVGRRIVVE
jgi:hypothetical protein